MLSYKLAYKNIKRFLLNIANLQFKYSVKNIKEAFFKYLHTRNSKTLHNNYFMTWLQVMHWMTYTVSDNNVSTAPLECSWMTIRRNLTSADSSHQSINQPMADWRLINWYSSKLLCKVLWYVFSRPSVLSSDILQQRCPALVSLGVGSVLINIIIVDYNPPSPLSLESSSLKLGGWGERNVCPSKVNLTHKALRPQQPVSRMTAVLSSAVRAFTVQS